MLLSLEWEEKLLAANRQLEQLLSDFCIGKVFTIISYSNPLIRDATQNIQSNKYAIQQRY